MPLSHKRKINLPVPAGMPPVYREPDHIVQPAIQATVHARKYPVYVSQVRRGFREYGSRIELCWSEEQLYRYCRLLDQLFPTAHWGIWEP